MVESFKAGKLWPESGDPSDSQANALVKVRRVSDDRHQGMQEQQGSAKVPVAVLPDIRSPARLRPPIALPPMHVPILEVHYRPSLCAGACPGGALCLHIAPLPL